jgi:exonuclease III
MNTLSILDYNIWFDKYNMAERTISLIDVIEEKKADVLLLQEVTPKVFEILIMTLTKLGYTNYFPEIILKPYDCVIFSKFPIVDNNYKNYNNTKMGRALITATIQFPVIIKNGNELNVKNINILLGTSHFESFFEKKYSNIKKDQYLCVKEYLDNKKDDKKEYKYIIFGGDTNITNDDEDKSFFKDISWNDIWDDIENQEENKYTYDTETNKNLIMRGIKNLRSRIDRILYKGDIVVREFELIKEGNFIIPPSDHHGLFTRLEIII